MITVYTALFGAYDVLSPAPSIPGVRFVLFTDQADDVAGWETMRPETTEASPAIENRKYKTRPHWLFPTVDWTIYMDANLTLTVDPRDITKECSPGLNVFRHNKRSCAYQEGEEVRRRVPGQLLNAQISHYRQRKFPENYGLFWGGLLIRSPEANAFNELWWKEIKAGVVRDQVSMPFSMWVTGVPCNVLEGDIPFYGGVNRFCVRKNHRSSAGRAAPS